MSLFRGIDFENLEDGELIQFFGVHMLRWGDIERATGIKPTIAFIEDDTLKQQNADLVAALEDTQKLLDNIYEEDIVLSTNMDAVYKKNKQALAQVGE